MIWNFIEDIVGEQKILLYEETKPEILVELGIVSHEDWEKEGFVTELEALAVINRISAGDDETDLMMWWYGDDSLAKYDSLPEEHKQLLVSLACEGINPILKYSEFDELDFEGNITYADVYLYVGRLLMDSSGCAPIPHEFLVRPADDVIYEVLYQKGLIESADTANCNKSIPRREFYELLHKTIFYEFVDGGYIDKWTRYVDKIQSRN